MKSYYTFLDKLSDEGFVEREAQRILVWNLLDLVKKPENTQYAVQAPTGTGKSIAALLAGVEAAQENLGRVVIGTSTVILSEQYTEDIALINRAFPDVKISVLKGASHYVCWNKVDKHMQKVSRWEDTFEECKRELIAFNSGRTDRIPSWAQANTDDCRDCMGKTKNPAEMKGKEIEKFDKCEFSKARVAAKAAHVIVTSHAMIAADLRVKIMTGGGKTSGEEGVIGKVGTYIFDEAHKLNSLLYTQSVTPWDVRKLAKHGLIKYMDGHKQRFFVEHFEDMMMLAFPEKNKTGRTPARISEYLDQAEAKKLRAFFPDVTELATIKASISGAVFSYDDLENNKIHRELNDVVGGLSRAAGVLKIIEETGEMNGDLALWRSTSRFGGGEESLGYNLRSMEASPWLLDALKEYRVAWMSATLGIDSDRTYVLDSFGIKGTELYELDSPFDFSEQMDVMFVSEKKFNRFSDDSFINTIEWLNGLLPGGTLVLTDSHKTSEWIARDMEQRGYPARAQDKSSAKVNAGYVAAHKQDVLTGLNPVLSGVDVFSTGLNLKREDCSAVFVHTIKPLRVPRQYMEWRKRWLEAQYKDPFTSYILPEQAIVLEQQIGRLIRTEGDRGVVLLSANMDNEEQREILRAALARFPGARMISQAAGTAAADRWQ